MRKEVLLAVFIGLALGLVITYGVYIASRGDRPESPAASPLTTIPTASPTTDTSELVLTSPPDESVQKEAGITIAGTTWADSFVVILVNGSESITTSDPNGNFSIKTKLRGGANIILVTALNEDGKKVSQERTVVLADDSVIGTDDATPSASPSPKAKL